jgi:hypothetical protein
MDNYGTHKDAADPQLVREAAAFSCPLQLKTAIREFIAAHNAKATPFVWTNSADEILASMARLDQRTLDLQAAPLIVRTTRSGHTAESTRIPEAALAI